MGMVKQNLLNNKNKYDEIGKTSALRSDELFPVNLM